MKNKDCYAVILAGGSGTRFWPASRQDKPKQFLNIIGKKTLFEQTIERIKPLIPMTNVFIVTGAAYTKEIKKEIAVYKIPPKNILAEPSGKNTAPAICWGAAKIHQINKDAVVAVLPSDHLISKERKFLKDLNAANRLAQKDYLVTFGITPTRPETGYGYLKIKKAKTGEGEVLEVDRFAEKPSLQVAKQFLKAKTYLWNSGMFVFKAAVILDELNAYQPKITKVFKGGTGLPYLRKVWHTLPDISIDYGVMERSERVAAVKVGNIGWTDLGSWESLAEILSKDGQGNIIEGNVIALDCKNSYLKADKRVVATVGLEDMIVIDTKDALLICRSDRSQAVKDIVSCLKKKNAPQI